MNWVDAQKTKFTNLSNEWNIEHNSFLKGQLPMEYSIYPAVHNTLQNISVFFLLLQNDHITSLAATVRNQIELNNKIFAPFIADNFGLALLTITSCNNNEDKNLNSGEWKNLKIKLKKELQIEYLSKYKTNTVTQSILFDEITKFISNQQKNINYPEDAQDFANRYLKYAENLGVIYRDLSRYAHPTKSINQWSKTNSSPFEIPQFNIDINGKDTDILDDYQQTREFVLQNMTFSVYNFWQIIMHYAVF